MRPALDGRPSKCRMTMQPHQNTRGARPPRHLARYSTVMQADAVEVIRSSVEQVPSRLKRQPRLWRQSPTQFRPLPATAKTIRVVLTHARKAISRSSACSWPGASELRVVVDLSVGESQFVTEEAGRAGRQSHRTDRADRAGWPCHTTDTASKMYNFIRDED